MAVFRFADHFNIGFEFQNLSEFFAHNPIVVSQQDSDLFHGCCLATNIFLLINVNLRRLPHSVYGVFTPLQSA
jgi:hypothetical protein